MTVDRTEESPIEQRSSSGCKSEVFPSPIVYRPSSGPIVSSRRVSGPPYEFRSLVYCKSEDTVLIEWSPASCLFPTQLCDSVSDSHSSSLPKPRGVYEYRYCQRRSGHHASPESKGIRYQPGMSWYSGKPAVSYLPSGFAGTFKTFTVLRYPRYFNRLLLHFFPLVVLMWTGMVRALDRIWI